MVIIKNMETIPKGCSKCNLCINGFMCDDGWFGECVLNDKVVKYSHSNRDIDCPLQETKPVKLCYFTNI